MSLHSEIPLSIDAFIGRSEWDSRYIGDRQVVYSRSAMNMGKHIVVGEADVLDLKDSLIAGARLVYERSPKGGVRETPFVQLYNHDFQIYFDTRSNQVYEARASAPAIMTLPQLGKCKGRIGWIFTPPRDHIGLAFWNQDHIQHLPFTNCGKDIPPSGTNTGWYGVNINHFKPLGIEGSFDSYFMIYSQRKKQRIHQAESWRLKVASMADPTLEHIYEVNYQEPVDTQPLAHLLSRSQRGDYRWCKDVSCQIEGIHDTLLAMTTYRVA